MKEDNIIIFCLLFSSLGICQTPIQLIYDAGHLKEINENALVRLSAENQKNAILEQIHSKTNDIQLNLSSVSLTQQIIHQAFTTVDQAIKSSKMVLEIYAVSKQIIDLSEQILQQARAEPHLLLFAQNLTTSFKERSLKMASEVSEFILTQGIAAMMDHAKRDALLKRISIDLHIIRALVFSIHKTISYVKLNGIYRSLNPYQQYINQDKQKADQILLYYKLLYTH